MSIEYQTVRVRPDTHKRMEEIQKKIQKRGLESLPVSTRNVSVDPRTTMVTFGSLLAASIESYDRELELLDMRSDLIRLYEKMSATKTKGMETIAEEFRLLLVRQNIIQDTACQKPSDRENQDER